MQIHRLRATFGRLHDQTLTLTPGLNILTAPNETGKSTWCAFLLAMLYGIDSRQRDKSGCIADKNRFAPWDGAPMEGTLTCTHQDQPITLTRFTQRAAAPMGGFSATTTDTANPIPWLDGQTCGETLLGVGRDVYQRSGFLHQAGLAVSQTQELERRITALITTGQEDASFTQAMDLLRHQRNRLRYNKTGEIPQLEAKAQEVTAQLQALAQLDAQLAQGQEALTALTAQGDAIAQQLAQWDAFLAQEAQDAIEADKRTADTALAHAQTMEDALTRDNIPPSETIMRLRGAIVNLETTRRSVEKAMTAKDEALRARAAAGEALSAHPFAGQSVEHARHWAKNLPSVKKSLPIVPVLLGALAGGGVYFWLENILYAALTGVGVLVLGLAVQAMSHSAHQKKLRRTFFQKHGVTDGAGLDELAQIYADLSQANDDAIAAAAGASAAYDGLYGTLTTNEQAILLEVRRFAPLAFDVTAADDALRSAATRRKEVHVAQSSARDAQLRYQWQTTGKPIPGAAPRIAKPAQSQDQLTEELDDTQRKIISAQRTVTFLEGQYANRLDATALTADLQQLQGQIAWESQQFDAMSLAMDTLGGCNTELQNRFAPQLGKATAAIFHALTQGRYSAVTLDRDLHFSAQLEESPLYRDIALLSAGATDQLYLAARLAICDLLLPPDAPIVLDDALTNFDDTRCEIALEHLQTLSQSRQVILFSCHAREAAWGQGRDGVSVQELS